MKPKTYPKELTQCINFTKEWRTFYSMAVEALAEYITQDTSVDFLAIIVEHPYAPCHYMMQLSWDAEGNTTYTRTTWLGAEDYPKFHNIMESLKYLDKSKLRHTIRQTTHFLPSWLPDSRLQELLNIIFTLPNTKAVANGIDGLCYHLFCSVGNKRHSTSWYGQPLYKQLAKATEMLHEIDLRFGYHNFA